MSPTSKKGTITPSTPFGSIEEPFNQIGTAILNHATFVARGFSGDIPELTNLIIEGLNHQGYAFLNILQPCVTYNKDMTFDWYRKHIYKLDKNHDSTNKKLAIEKSMETNKLGTGIFYQINKPTFHQQVLNNDQPLAKKDISSINIQNLL